MCAFNFRCIEFFNQGRCVIHVTLWTNLLIRHWKLKSTLQMHECDILFYYHKYTILIFIIRKYLNNFHFIHNLNSSLLSFKTKEQFLTLCLSKVGFVPRRLELVGKSLSNDHNSVCIVTMVYIIFKWQGDFLNASQQVSAPVTPVNTLKIPAATWSELQASDLRSY